MSLETKDDEDSDEQRDDDDDDNDDDYRPKTIDNNASTKKSSASAHKRGKRGRGGGKISSVTLHSRRLLWNAVGRWTDEVERGRKGVTVACHLVFLICIIG